MSKYFANYLLKNYPQLNKDISESTKKGYEREVAIIKKKHENKNN